MTKNKQFRKLQRSVKLLPQVIIIWMISVLSLIFVELLIEEKGIEIDLDEFKTELLNTNQVLKVEIINEDYAAIYINPQYLQTKFKGPHYQVDISSLEDFRKVLQTESLYQKIEINYIDKDPWREILLYWMELVLFVTALWFFILMIGLSTKKRKLKRLDL